MAGNVTENAKQPPVFQTDIVEVIINNEKGIVDKKLIKKKRVNELAPTNPTTSSSKKSSITIKQDYLKKIHQIISDKKFYPLSAKKLKQQGVVRVLLTLHRSGRIHSVEVQSKFENLKGAHSKALMRGFIQRFQKISILKISKLRLFSSID